MTARLNDYTYDMLAVGHKTSFYVDVTYEMFIQFRGLTGDDNPLHCDETFAAQKGYSGPVAYGLLTASFLSTLVGVHLPGKHGVIHSIDVAFPNPVYAGDRLLFTGEVSAKHDLYHIVDLSVTATNRTGLKVLRGKIRIQVGE